MSQATPTTAGVVDTAKVAGRRTLRFESIDQMTAEVDRLVEAEVPDGSVRGQLDAGPDARSPGDLDGVRLQRPAPCSSRRSSSGGFCASASKRSCADAGRREDTRRGGRDVGDGARADGRSTGAVAVRHGSQVRGPHRPERHFWGGSPTKKRPRSTCGTRSCIWGSWPRNA